MPQNEKVTVRLPDEHMKMIDELSNGSLGVTRSNVVRSIIADYYESEWTTTVEAEPLIVTTVRLPRSLLRKLDASDADSRSAVIRAILSKALK